MPTDNDYKVRWVDDDDEPCRGCGRPFGLLCICDEIEEISEPRNCKEKGYGDGE